jgi:hypothetical protein
MFVIIGPQLYKIFRTLIILWLSPNYVRFLFKIEENFLNTTCFELIWRKQWTDKKNDNLVNIL